MNDSVSKKRRFFLDARDKKMVFKNSVEHDYKNLLWIYLKFLELMTFKSLNF